MENQRIRLSRQMLKDALIELLQEKELQKVTVYEICERAQINRTTFYKYYASQYDLLDDIEKDIFDALEQRLCSGDSLTDALSRTLAYLEEERTKCRLLINSTTDINFAEKLFSLPQIQILTQKHIPKSYTQAQLKHILTFIYHGGYAIVREWINAETRESPEEISELFLMLVSNIYDVSDRVFK